MSGERATPIATTPPLTSMLTEGELAKLRAGYEADPGALADAPLHKYSALFPGGAPFYRLSVETFYVHGSPPEAPLGKLDPKWREVAVLALFIERRQTFPLAVHVYWALMLGMTVEDLCEITLLMGFYASISSYSLALTTMQTALGALKTCADRDVSAPLEVFGVLFTAFVPAA